VDRGVLLRSYESHFQHNASAESRYMVLRVDDLGILDYDVATEFPYLRIWNTAAETRRTNLQMNSSTCGEGMRMWLHYERSPVCLWVDTHLNAEDPDAVDNTPAWRRCHSRYC